MISENDVINIIQNKNKHTKTLFSPLKKKINFLLKRLCIEPNSVLLGLSYIKKCNVDVKYIHNYTLCSIILANKYLSDTSDTQTILDMVDITLKEYTSIELEILNKLDWKLDNFNTDIYSMVGKIKNLSSILKIE